MPGPSQDKKKTTSKGAAPTKSNTKTSGSKSTAKSTNKGKINTLVFSKIYANKVVCMHMLDGLHVTTNDRTQCSAQLQQVYNAYCILFCEQYGVLLWIKLSKSQT